MSDESPSKSILEMRRASMQVLEVKEDGSMKHKNSMSDKIKNYLVRKLNMSEEKIKKRKRKKKIYRIITVGTAIGSIIISVVLAGTASLMFSPVLVSVLIIIGGVLTGISINFNFRNKINKIEKELLHMNEVKELLDFVTSCNGFLTEEEYSKVTKIIGLNGLRYDVLFNKIKK